VELPPDRDKRGTADADLEADLVELLKALRDLPDSHVRDEFVANIVHGEIEQLSRPGARNAFEDLCSAGCHRALLIAIVSLLRHRSSIETSWNAVVGSPEQREDICGELEAAAAALERAFPPAVFDTEAMWARVESIRRIPPPRLATELRLYSRTLRLGKLVANDIGVRSLEHVLMLILAGYVEKATRGSHHASIALIIAEVCSKPDYAEDAQKQWRFRNRGVLDNPSSVPSRIAESLNAVTLALNHLATSRNIE
jgi:hypothetical protein